MEHNHDGARIGRRRFIGLGIGGLVTALTGIEAAATPSPLVEKRGALAKRVLVIFEQGGLSHIDTWDPKPDAPLEHRSPFKPMSIPVPGMQFTELLAKTAKFAGKLTVVRCMILPTPGIGNSHPKGAQYLYSGEAPDGRVDMPDIGSVVTAQMGTEALYLLSNIMLPGTSEMANMTSVSFLPPGYACFKTGGSPANSNWKVPNLGLLAGIDGLHRSGAIGPAGRHESARPLGRNAALLRDRIRAHAENQRASGVDHWANAFSFAFAGVPGGPVVGSTVKEGGYVTSSIAYTLEVYAATIYDKLGIDHSKPIHMPSGRPIYLAAKGKPIPELF